MQSEIAKYLAVSDAMVFPSKREGIPVCLMESLAMGVPAITRDSRGCRDVVRDGLDGFVLRDCTVANLADAIRRIADSPDLQRQMSARALATRERFDRGHFIRERKTSTQPGLRQIASPLTKSEWIPHRPQIRRSSDEDEAIIEERPARCDSHRLGRSHFFESLGELEFRGIAYGSGIRPRRPAAAT